MAEHDRLRAKRAKDRAKGVWNFGSLQTWPEFDIVYTGKLTLAYLGIGSGGMRRSWSDGKSKSLEMLTEEFIDGVTLILVASAEEDRIRAENKRKRDILIHRRDIAAKRAKREEDRLSFLRNLATTRREAEDLRATIALVSTDGRTPADYQRMIDWATERLAALDAQTSVEYVQSTLAELRLYPDPDDLFDPEGDPPPKTNHWDD